MLASNQLSFYPDKKLAVAEMSDFSANGSLTADGVQILGKDGSVLSFKRAQTVRDGSADDEIQYFVYVPTRATIISNPNLKGWRLKAFND